MKSINLSKWILAPVFLALIYSLFYLGSVILIGDSSIIGSKFISIKEGKPLIVNTSFLFDLLLPIVGLLAIISSIFLIIGLIKKEFIFSNKSQFIQCGLFFSILTISVYGIGVRIISDHILAGTLFFFTSILFLLLKLVQHQSVDRVRGLKSLQWLPILLMIIYTMGFTGYQKIFNSNLVIPNYEKMFEDTVFAQIPEGIPTLIYILGIFELAAAILALISLVKGEFLSTSSKTFLKWSLFVTVSTFFQLSIGLFTIVNIPGAVNLLLYAIFTSFIFYSLDMEKAENLEK